jgi:N-succinyldiaminopimelate aminotransferase
VPRPALSRKLEGFGTTIFTEMTRLANEHGAVNLSQGFPDFDGPDFVKEAAIAAVRDGRGQYARMSGIPEIHAALSAKYRRDYGLSYAPDAEITVTSGATEAIFAAIQGVCNAGDEVVLFEPYYDSYAATVALAGATRRVVTLERDGAGWGFDPDALRRSVTPATRLLVLNSPHNPTGTVFGPAELAFVAELATEHDLIVLSDEVYEHLIFDGGRHVPIATLPGMRERTVTVSSAGKTFSVTGWKIGWACAPTPLLTAVRTVKQFLTYVSGAPLQPAVAQVLADAPRLAPRAALQEQRDLLCTGLAELGFDVVIPQSTYFATVDVGNRGATALGFCRDLPHSAGVVAIPSSVFYDSAVGDRYVRFAFCKRPEVLAEALRRLKAVAR